jgi:hypothetical protein
MAANDSPSQSVTEVHRFRSPALLLEKWPDANCASTNGLEAREFVTYLGIEPAHQRSPPVQLRALLSTIGETKHGLRHLIDEAPGVTYIFVS